MLQFADLKKKQITICQKLIPIGKTRENIDTFNAMANDEYVSDNKNEIKKLIKEMARFEIDEKLSNIKGSLDFTNLFTLMNKVDESENKEEILQELFFERAALAKTISSELNFKYTSAKTITEKLPKFISNNYDGDEKEKYLELVDKVKSRQAMFNRFEESIDFIAGELIKKNTLVYRLLVENSQIFLSNYKRIKEQDISSIITNLDVDDSIKTVLQNQCISFTPDNYNELLTQAKIDKYNYCISMINSELNVFCSVNKLSYSSYELKKLYKMILCEKDLLFEKINKFTDDEQVIDTYNDFITNVNDSNLFEKINSSAMDYDNIYIRPNFINAYSNITYGKWNIVSDCIKAHVEDLRLAGKNKITYEKYVENISIVKIDTIVNDYSSELGVKVNGRDYIEIIKEQLLHKYKEVTNDNISLKSDASIVSETIRKELDYALGTIRLLKLFDFENENFNSANEMALNEILDTLNPANLLYNMARNYITQKPSQKSKLNLVFDTNGFAGGWSESVESQKRVTLLKDDEGNKYLGIYNLNGCRANNTSVAAVVKNIQENLDTNSTKYYEKMIYSAVPDAAKDIPRLFINKSENNELIKKFKNKEHKENEEFKNELIEFIKRQIALHPTWSKYKFVYKDNYGSYEDFCNDINKQGYMLNWEKIDKSIIDNYVESGCIYLFRIHNNDYSKYKKTYSKVKAHTQYLDYLFSDENSKTKLIKLLGGAEVFYREPQIKNPYMHKKGSVLVNKKYKNGSPIGNEYKDLVIKAQTTALDNVSTKVSSRYIVKDNRYRKEQFELHFPILIGEERATDYEKICKNYIKNSNHTIVIGRGKNHLLYVSIYENNKVINAFPLDTVNGTNFKAKLEQIEELKNEQRKTWKNISSNRELLNGYVSAAIAPITDMVLKYKATVVIEIGDSSSKSRNLLPNRAYKIFKEALMKKLAFLTDKNKEMDEPGGLLHPYHLVNIDARNPNRSINAAQNGIVMQVPAFYCALTDPESNLCNLTYAKTLKEKKQVLKKIGEIKYNKDEDIFTFIYDISKFNKDMKGVYECNSNGLRLIYNNNSEKKINLSQYLKNMLQCKSIDYKSGIINYDSEDKESIEAMFLIIRYTLQMLNKTFYISPVTNLTVQSNDCTESMINQNMYNRFLLLKDNLLLNKPIKYLSIKDVYSKLKP